MLANDRESFPAIEGEVRFGSADHVEANTFRHQMLFNSEDDIHFPTLTVTQTMRFALRNKAPDNRPAYLQSKDDFAEELGNDILEQLGIGHTKGTLVGNEFVRGVSGGERKRVSIAEVMAGQAPIQCWDNSTRGLDASTALDLGRVLRRTAQEQKKSIVATFYQTGNGLYDQFDKVLVLCEGRTIYYGPRALAKSYFEDMGFVCPSGGAVADFLTAVPVHTERVIRSGFENKVPNTAEEFESRYYKSAIWQAMDQGTVDYNSLSYEIDNLRDVMALERQRSSLLRKMQSVYTVSLMHQVWACTIRSFEIMWGDRWSIAIKAISALLQALVCGSVFYNLSDASDSVFLRPGALFFGILYFGLQSLAETTASFLGRPILSRHKRFAYYRPTAFCIASVIVDIPVYMFQVTVFTIVLYFMCHFQYDAAKFFTYWIVLNVTVFCFASEFRAIGALFKNFGNASKVSGFTIMIMMVCAGYMIPFNSMHVWFRWIFYINPASHAFESLMANEWSGLELTCITPQYIPYGESYTDDRYRSCTVAGSSGKVIPGDAYIAAQYNHSKHHVWRGFGIIIGFWIFFACLTAIGFEKADSSGGSSRLLFKRGSKLQRTPVPVDVEKASVTTDQKRSPTGPPAEDIASSSHQSTFTWKNLNYYVKYRGEDKQLLRDVCGYVKPGCLLALMGTSGAGKTTLMDVLAQRKDAGRIEGSILVDGLPQDITFQRTTGYCEQNDVHEATATVREALLFSARLRQDYEIPDQEKVDYVENIIDLLELRDIQDALVGTPGAGLTIEQKKRLTLGVELVAKPKLLFLDEPTSGLDGQSAFSIVRFMRKLAGNGQAVICTIHQPSAFVFNAFDSLLLLAKGGRTTYFGETGEGSSKLLEYFARNGAPCAPDVNPAEHIIDVVQGRQSSGQDWAQIWRESPECKRTLDELDHLNESIRSLAQGHSKDNHTDSSRSFATPLLHQMKQVTIRQSVALWRNPDYVWNKILLHVVQALFSGFAFWKVGNGTFDLQLRLFSVFNFVFIAPGVINQLQPLYLRNRDIFETREKKSKTYHWFAFVFAQCVSEIPWLILCGTLYFICWYFPSGLPVQASISGQIFFQMILYELLYTSIGQAIATYAPNEYFASLMNPIVLGAGLITFCGIVVPYGQITSFWRHWLYWLDPFSYLVGGLLTQLLWDVDVRCSSSELTSIPLPPDGSTTCGEYMAAFLKENAGSYAMVFVMMKLRSKATKSASG
ncbi:ABC multidrug transporter [Lasiodiplodia theobromae]|uniref:ABC multidrug transporter n=1 Tax=Lasiodiplodia theobromae TaxID=45133 RepID=UPI0015C338E4|nr:ABC multidrug transporter [Lasiodiplodia theobromae]KAF4537636.1 ABC multidrug transporter [Lasiodiplodia theobromae]